MSRGYSIWEMTAPEILHAYRHFGVVGLSSNSHRASNRVALELINRGYFVVPINPLEESVFGLRSYPTLELAAKDHEIEVVDIFRHAKYCSDLTRQAVAIGARAVWLQLGIISEDAQTIALQGGLDFVMDDCPSRYLRHLS